ncbi:TonB-dependent receptor [Fulvivirgaceae bacterium BMA12]|uniref:TonB-dependent receptor n=1 Tax=Agaribacillus aureus TaxID=3051825 RepID=A0ABT8LI43_9BACT|nr:TonB-dependent receptor [Fulvivirgaceae bacterium BMA12]
MKAVAVVAQEGSVKIITKSYQDKQIADILEELENYFDLQIYYLPADSTIIKGDWQFEGNTLEEVLSRLLDRTGLGYMAYRNYAIVIAEKRLLQQRYSSDFYQLLEQRQSITAQSIYGGVREITVGDVKQMNDENTVRIAGKIRDSETRKPIVGATLFFSDLGRGVSTDINGYYAVNLDVGRYDLTINYVGYDELLARLTVFSNDQLDLEMEKEAITLEEVVVESRAPDQNVNAVLMGVEELSAKSIKGLPTFLGEADVIKSLLFLPGVSTVGEGASGFNVRGGSVGENLILQDEAFIFNPSHALGFFSTFNPDLIKGVTLFKGTMPAQFGGRLSSVLDVGIRDGSYQKFKIKGGLGVVSSRISLEAPIKKEKTSFILGGRITYSDWLLNLINVPDVQNSEVSFYDLNARISHNFSDKAKLTISGYTSRDELTFADEFGYDYQTDGVQINVRNVLNPRLISSFSAVYSQYQSALIDPESSESFRLDNGISYYKFKEQFRYAMSEHLNLDFGGTFIKYELDPGKITPVGNASLTAEKELPTTFAREFVAFANGEWDLSAKIAISAGLRFTRFENVGPGVVNRYVNNSRPEETTLTGTENIGDGEVIEGYERLEPRVSAKLMLNTQTSLKLGYSRTAQFLHQISNSDATTPIDIWQFSNNFIAPQKADNFSVGLFRNFKNNQWETSVELYYRETDRLVEYRDFSDLLANDLLETELLTGIGKAYGAELSIRKRRGVVNGWLAYTYARTKRRVNGELPEFTISNGNWYRSNFDKPHDLTLVTNFEINKRHKIAVNFNYNTGRPTTAPIGKFGVGNVQNIPIYSERNALRIPDYHRLDIAYTLSPGFRKDRKWKSSWTLSVYNLLGRRNAFAVFYTQPGLGNLVANRLSVLGSAFPAITYNFELR